MIAVACVWAGLVLSALGLPSVVRPPRFLGIRSRRSAAAVLSSGVLLVAVGWILPAREVQVDALRDRIDEFAPVAEVLEGAGRFPPYPVSAGLALGGAVRVACHHRSDEVSPSVLAAAAAEARP